MGNCRYRQHRRLGYHIRQNCRLGYHIRQIADGAIVNADINASAAIALSKLATGALPTDITVASANLVNGTVALADLAAAVANALVPVGTISAYAGDTAPTGWLLCNGTSTTGYTALAALVGATTPDFTGHTLVGKGSAPFDGALLSKFGSTTSTAAHTHGIDHDHASFTSGNDSPDHTHTQSGPTGTTTYDSGGIPQFATDSDIQTSGASVRHQHSIDVPAFTGTSGASSVGSAHGNVQPSALINFIIKHD